MPLLAPVLSLPDPIIEGEGSIDPLSLLATYERLANRILPAVTVRMTRPRFVTTIAIGARVCQELDETAIDGQTPAWVVFEWLVIEALVRNREHINAKGRIPGLLKVQNALNNKRTVSPSSYLKTPTIFGITGVYRRLATQLRVVTDDMLLDEEGHELIATWERDKGLPGFSGGSRGAGADFLKSLRAAVQAAMNAGHTTHHRTEFWQELAMRCDPEGDGTQEKRQIYRLLRQEAGPFARALPILDAIEKRGHIVTRDVESDFLGSVAKHAPAELRDDLRAIDDYETLCRNISDALDLARYLGAPKSGGVNRVSFSSHNRLPSLVEGVRAGCERIRNNETLWERERDSMTTLIDRFGDVTEANDLFMAVIAHHVEAQSNKAPDGKRAWFEELRPGHFFVRPDYVLDELGESQPPYLHDYRTPSVSFFLNELGRLS